MRAIDAFDSYYHQYMDGSKRYQMEVPKEQVETDIPLRAKFIDKHGYVEILTFYDWGVYWSKSGHGIHKFVGPV